MWETANDFMLAGHLKLKLCCCDSWDLSYHIPPMFLHWFVFINTHAHNTLCIDRSFAAIYCCYQFAKASSSAASTCYASTLFVCTLDSCYFYDNSCCGFIYNVLWMLFIVLLCIIIWCAALPRQGASPGAEPHWTTWWCQILHDIVRHCTHFICSKASILFSIQFSYHEHPWLLSNMDTFSDSKVITSYKSNLMIKTKITKLLDLTVDCSHNKKLIISQ